MNNQSPLNLTTENPLLCKEEQDQIDAILQQTLVSDEKYTDNQIHHLINPNKNLKQNRPSLKNSIHSQLSAASESDQNQFLSRDPSLGSQGNKNPSRKESIDNQQSSDSQDFGNPLYQHLKDKLGKQEQDINEIFVNCFKDKQQILSNQRISVHSRFQKQKSHKNFPFKSFYQQINKLQRPYSLQQVQKQYPSFLLSKPTYKIDSTAKEKKSAFGNVLSQANVRIIDIGFTKKDNYCMAAVTSSNQLIIHEINSSKTLHSSQILKPGQQIQSLKWSRSMKYLIYSNNQTEVKLVQFREYQSGLSSQNYLQWMKTPQQIFTLQHPKIKNTIIQCHFIEENPVKVLLVDDEYEIYIVEMKKQFLSLKPNITKLPIKFNEFSQLKLQKIYGQKGNHVTLLIVGGEQYVTFAIIQPNFEIILVYSKEQHFPHAKKGGYPNILFINTENSQLIKSPQIMIVWDKHIELIRLNVEELGPFTYKIQTVFKYVLPDSTILFGNLSDTLFYQLTRLQLKIYSLNEILNFCLMRQKSEQENYDAGRFAGCVYSRKISFDQFPEGEKIEELVSNPVLSLKDLKTIKRFISCCNNNLFICLQDCLYSLSIDSFSSYIESTIQSINDWKVGLQLLNDGISRQITVFDNMKEQLLRKQLKEYSSRYIEFLKGVIPDCMSNNEIWKQQMCFLFMILVRSGEQRFLLKEILIKLYRISPQLLKIFEPFILMGHITEVQPETLDLLLSVVERNISRRIVYAVRNSLEASEDHNELAHLINNILIRYQFYLQLIWINHFFSDYYTPFVILVSKYQKEFNKKQSQFLIHLEETYELKYKHKPSRQVIEKELNKFKEDKTHFAKLLSYLSFDTFRLINASQYRKFCAEEQKFHISKVKAQYLLETLIPLMHLKLNKILIQNSSEQFFDFILQELFEGNCLEILTELKAFQKHSNPKDWLKEIVDNIPFRLVVEIHEQGRYWMLLIRLMIRKIISTKIFPGIYYLTLEHPNQSSALVQLINLFSKQCQQTLNQELYSIDVQKKTELFDKLKNSEYMELLKILGGQLKREMQVLDCLIKCKACHTVQLIEYMNRILLNASYISMPFRQKTLSQLKDILKRNIKLFTSIDPERTSTFIIQNYKQQMKQFIAYLSDNPKEQLNLLKQILNHYSYGQFLNNQKCKYLELLAITGQKQHILKELKSHMFPLDEAIEICKKYEILDAWAFLLVKSGGTGNSTIAIEIYFKLMKQHVENYKYNRKTHQRFIELRKSLLQQLDKCIQVCIELDIRATNNEETEWFLIVQQLENLRKHIYKTCSPDVESTVKQIIRDSLYPELIRQLLDQVPIEITLSYLKKSLNQLQPETSQLIIEQMVKACISQKLILKNAQQQISQSEISQRNHLFQETRKGFLTSSRCYQCMRKDIHTKIHYSCGHEIHPACNQDVKECISCKNNEETMIWKWVNLKDKVQKVIYYNPLDPNKDKTLSEIIRLSRQEKLKKYDESLQGYTMINI